MKTKITGKSDPAVQPYDQTHRSSFTAPAENTDNGIAQWVENTYYDGEDYLACQQHEWDDAVFRARMEIVRMEREAENDFRWYGT